MADSLVSIPEHGAQITEDDYASPALQLFFDDLVQIINARLPGGWTTLPVHTILELPPASAVGAGGLVYVSDEAQGAQPAFSDGTSWRRISDRGLVS